MMQNWDTYGAMPHNDDLYADPQTGRLTWIAWDHDRAFARGDAGAPPGGAPGFAPDGAPAAGAPGFAREGAPAGGAPDAAANRPDDPARAAAHAGAAGLGRGDAAVRPGGGPRSVTLDRADVGANWPLIRFLLDDPVYAADYATHVAELAADAFVAGRAD